MYKTAKQMPREQLRTKVYGRKKKIRVLQNVLTCLHIYSFTKDELTKIDLKKT